MTALDRARQGLPVRFEDLSPAEQETLKRIQRDKLFTSCFWLAIAVAFFTGLYVLGKLL